MTDTSSPADTPAQKEARLLARRERQETAAREGQEAMAEHRAKVRAEEEKSARLRGLRLAKEAADRAATVEPAPAKAPRRRKSSSPTGVVPKGK